MSEEEQDTKPREIWDEGFDEGERRLQRGILGQASSALVGGFDVTIAFAVVFTLSGALLSVANEEISHAVGALAFGLAFVLVSIGRSELFTENFLVPVGAFFAGRGTIAELGRMWGVTLLFNLIGIAILAALLTVDGVLPESAHEAAGYLGDKFVGQDFVEALVSAIVAGIVITQYTWLTLAVGGSAARILIALLIGYALLLPTLNHVVVSFSEVMLAVMSGATETDVGAVSWRLGLTVVGNTIGGVLFVTMTRLVQVSGEPRE